MITDGYPNVKTADIQKLIGSTQHNDANSPKTCRELYKVLDKSAG